MAIIKPEADISIADLIPETNIPGVCLFRFYLNMNKIPVLTATKYKCRQNRPILPELVI